MKVEGPAVLVSYIGRHLSQHGNSTVLSCQSLITFSTFSVSAQHSPKLLSY